MAITLKADAANGRASAANRARSATITAVAVILLSGCASLTGYPQRSPTADYVLPSTISDAAYYTEPDPGRQGQLRNELIFTRLRTINEQYDAFTKALNVQVNALSLGSDIALVSLGAVGTLVKSAATKTALAAATTIVAGTSTAVDKDLFYKNTIPAVIAEMDSDRAKVLVTLYTGLKESVSDYPLSAAEDALDDYRRAGSIPSAISKLTTAAENASASSKAQAAAALVGTYSYDDSGKLLQGFGWPSGAKNEDNQKKIRAEMTNEGVDTGVSVTSFVYMSQYRDQRAKVVSDLKLK
jgi:hypothetical protein